MMTVTLIGTAATMPLPDRATASAAIGCAGRWVLIDCGEGTQTAARRAKVSLMKVDVIALTHFHGDHLFGLPGLLQTLGTMNRTDPLTIVGPEGIAEALAPILTLAGDDLAYSVQLREMGVDDVLRLQDIHPAWPAEASVQAFPTQHRVVSLGYRFTLDRAGKFQAEKALKLGIPQHMWRELQQGRSVTAEGRTVMPQEVLGSSRRGLSVVYSGDTMPCSALEEAARGADLLIGEATYPDDAYLDKAAEFGHATYAGMAALAARAGVRRLWLTHFSAMIGDPEEHIAQAQAQYPAVCCGRDGMSEKLLFDR